MTEAEVKQPTAIAGIGKTQMHNFSIPQNNGGGNEGEGAAADVIDKNEAAPAAVADKVDKLPIEGELTAEQTKAFFKKLGIEDFKGEEDFEAIKAKLNPKAPLSDEEKLRLEQSEEKEMLDWFFENGGTIDIYNQYKQLANADLVQLSHSKEVAQLVSKGLSKEDAESVIKQRYFQNDFDEESVLQNIDEEDDAFDTRKATLKANHEKLKAIMSERLNNKGSYEQTQAKDFLNNLKQAVANRKEAAQKEEKYAADANTFIQSIDRKQTIDLGKEHDKPLDPVSYEVSDKVVKEVEALVKDSKAFKQFFLTEDGLPNLKNVIPLLLDAKSRQEAVREGFQDGRDRMTKLVQKRFGSANPQDIGVNGSRARQGNEAKSIGSLGKTQLH